MARKNCFETISKIAERTAKYLTEIKPVHGKFVLLTNLGLLDCRSHSLNTGLYILRIEAGRAFIYLPNGYVIGLRSDESEKIAQAFANICGRHY
ncbi:MAG: hypothetical protein ACP5I3_09970 [Thermoproteus sp.]